VAMRIYGLTAEIGPPSARVQRLFTVFTLERGLVAGAAAIVGGLGVIAYLFFDWASSAFGPMPLQQTLRPMIVGATAVAVGVQTVLMSLVYSMLGLRQSRA